MIQASLEALVQNVDLGILLEDGDRRVEITNANFCAMFGIPASPEALVGTDCSASAAAASALFQDPEAFLRGVESALDAGEPRLDELVLKDGRLWERRYVPLRSEGRSTGHAWIYRDVTRERAAQRQADGTVQFLEQISFGLRTPLHAIIGLAELGASVDDVGEARTLAAALRRAANDLLRTVEGTLALAHEAGPVVVERFDPVAVIEDAVGTLAGAARDREVPLRLFVRPDVPDTASGDPSTLRHVLTNLLAGLLEPRGVGRVVVEASAVVAPVGHELVVLIVREGGPAPAPIHPADRVGLAVSRRLAERLGGRIIDEARPEGRRLTLRVPLGHGAETRREPRLPEATRVGLLGPPGLEADAIRAALERLGARVSDLLPLERLAELPEGDVRVIAGSPADLDRVEIDGHGAPIVWVGSGDAACDHPVTRRGLSSAIRAALARTQRGTVPQRGERRDRVLVVEDSPANAAVIAAMLEHAGFVAHVAPDGARGLAAYRGGVWGVVLLDLDLPDQSGLEVARHIRAHEASAGRVATPIVACTAQVTSEARRRCLAAGMDGFLPKPFHRDRLVAEVERWLGTSTEVLVVDDSSDTRLLYARWLGDLGCLVHLADSGAAGVARFAERAAAVALVDVDMPEMDGIEVTGRLRALPGGRQARILVVTGHADPELRKAALDAGADAVLLKPVSRDILVELVRSGAEAGRPPEPPPAVRPLAMIEAEIADLVPDYLDDRRANVGRGAELLQSGDLGELERMGHQLKGSGASYGFPEITAQGEALFAAASIGDADGCGRALRALERYLGEVEVVIRSR